MHRVCLLVLIAALLGMAVPAAAVAGLSINASPGVAHIGDTVLLNGSVTGINTIAVYLFLTGPDLDTRGVALDNLNIPTGRGMFTTAPVQLSDGTWTYVWDTSIILGSLEPGTYTIYVVDSPVDRLRFAKTRYATAEIRFLPSEKPTEKTPLNPLLPVIGIVGGGCLLGIVSRKL
jgi:multisubunit Na+/H+ antiporter MnhF subunit